MAEQQVANFTYIPAVQGYDTELWRTFFGDPTTFNNKLSFRDAEAIHYATFMRGEISFVLNVPTAPTAGNSRKVGLRNPSDGSYAYFDFSSSGTLSAACARGGAASTSAAVVWNTAWTATDTVFKIRWEAGQVYFFVNAVKVALLSETGSALVGAENIPCVPMSPFISNRQGDALLVGLFVAKNVQGYYRPAPVTGGDLVEGLVFEGDNVSLAESTTVSVVEKLVFGGDNISLAESTTVSVV